MSNYLLAITIGPVQEFIAAARRTSDLYAGSALLVEIARETAKSVQQHGTLIFPAAPEDDPSKLDGPNKIVAIVSGKPCEIADKARKKAEKYLSACWDKVAPEIPALDPELPAQQIKQFLEFYAAWWPVADDESDYDDARRNADHLLAGRKALRNFDAPLSRAGRMKSPLDPSRDSVLEDWKDRYGNRPFYLKKTETLDAVSLLKRFNGTEAGKGRSVGTAPSTSLMAALSILPMADEATINELEKIAKDAGAAIDLGDLMFPNRLNDEIQTLEDMKKRGTIDPAQQKILNYLNSNKVRIEELRGQLLKAADKTECPPYYAILAADGDKMGALLNGMKKSDQHIAFSQSLSRFALKAETIVNSHKGFLVYSGGDDVLALLPVTTAIACAADLASEFRQIMEKLLEEQKVPWPEVGGTLSVGIAVVHFLESLQGSLSQARAAEQHAKIKRNSLAVALHTRGGEAMKVSCCWDENPSKLWEQYVGAFEKDLSRGFPYELRSLAREWIGSDLDIDLLRNEARRILDRKKGGGEEKSSGAQAIDERFGLIDTPEALEEFSKQLVIARFLAGYAPKSKTGEPSGKEAPNG
jgi:CRISPR-associated protein Cmr2